MSQFLYQKRPGTAGISGHLYETKLLSLILYRALHDINIEEIYLGTNIDGIGIFDDICFRVKFKGCQRPIAVFLQAKHRDDENKTLAAISKSDLTNFYNSYVYIKNKFNSGSEDPLFTGKFDDVDCVFVYYTTAKGLLENKKYQNDVIDKLNHLVATGGTGAPLKFENIDDKYLNKIILYEQIKKLAGVIAKYVLNGGKKYEYLMKDVLIQKYHVILAQKVFVITKTSSQKYNLAQFQSTFWHTEDDTYLNILRDNIFVEVLRHGEIDENEIDFTYLFFSPCVEAISSLIVKVIMYNEKSGKLEFVNKEMSKNTYLREQLQKINVSQTIVNRAIKEAAMEKINFLSFKVPVIFGNQDLGLKGNERRIERRLEHLSKTLNRLMKEARIKHELESESDIIVKIGDNIHDRESLQLNGGIASAVGNLLILDDETKLLKFQCPEFLSNFSKRLYEKLNVEHINKYRFDVTIDYFPKLSFDIDQHEKNLAEDFLKRFIFFTHQMKEDEVENILKKDIDSHQNSEQYNFQLKSNAIFQIYHNEIQKWWLKQDKVEYLTKQCDMFHKASEDVISMPLLSILNASNKFKFENNNIIFMSDVIKHLQLIEKNNSPLGINLFLTQSVTWSVNKIVQYLQIYGKKHILINLKCVLRLSSEEYNKLHEELIFLNEDIIIILACDIAIDIINTCGYLSKIFQMIDERRVIVVLNKSIANTIKTLVLHINSEVVDKSMNLKHLTYESQQLILQKTIVQFQGIDARLDLVLQNFPRYLIKEHLLIKIMDKKHINIGKVLTDSRYEEIKPFYVNRHIKLFTPKEDIIDTDSDDSNFMTVLEKHNRTIKFKNNENFYLGTLHDIRDHIVVITAQPGMGKSTLLSYLALKTKAFDLNIWIVRLNLLDYSRNFYMWQKTKIDIDIINILKFFCIAVLNDENSDDTYHDTIILKEMHGEVILSEETNKIKETAIFEINMFLYYYNKRKVIFLFDGFDEICPHYEKEVIKMIKVLSDYNSRKHPIWITSRTYNNIHRNLEYEFGDSYELNSFSETEQEIFLERFWNSKLNLNDLNKSQLEKIDGFVTFLKELSRTFDFNRRCGMKFKYHCVPLHRIYLYALRYFKNSIKYVPFLDDKEKYLIKWNINVSALEHLIFSQYNGEENDLDTMNLLTALPLHTFIIADYFQNQIKDVTKNTHWDLNISTISMYKRFLKTKLMKIRFEVKNNMDTCRPDVKLTCDKEYNDFIVKHNKLAAYATFLRDMDKLFTKQDINEIKKTISSIKSGAEKSGIIHSIVDDIPRFIHLTFAEYFAVEFISDVLKTGQPHEQRKMWDFVVNTMFLSYNLGVLNIFDDKLMMDDELKAITKETNNRRIIFELLMKQRNTDRNKKHNSTLYKATSENLSNFIALFVSIVEEYVNKNNNLDHFIDMILEGGMMEHAIQTENFEFINIVFNIVRKAGISKVNNLYKPFKVGSSIHNFECDYFYRQLALHCGCLSLENIAEVFTHESFIVIE